MSECKNCTKYKGDCTYHHVDTENHIHYDVPNIANCTRTGDCEYYEESRTIRKIVLSDLSDRYQNAHEDYYLLQAIRVIRNLSDKDFEDLLKEGETE